MKYVPENVKNKVGKIICSEEFYLSMFKEVLYFLSYGIILRVEHISYNSTYEVTMLNEFFDVIEEGFAGVDDSRKHDEVSILVGWYWVNIIAKMVENDIV